MILVRILSVSRRTSQSQRVDTLVASIGADRECRSIHHSQMDEDVFESQERV